MAMSEWMESVTGRSNSEHQAWRDNFNGGWAAGDFTGNVNRGIAEQRYASGEWNNEIAHYGGFTGRNPYVPDGYIVTLSADGNTSYVTRTNAGRSLGTGAVVTSAVNPAGVTTVGGSGSTDATPKQAGGSATHQGGNAAGPAFWNPFGWKTTNTGENPNTHNQTGVTPKNKERFQGPVFAPMADNSQRVSDPKDNRYMPIGFGLTWESPGDMFTGEQSEDEMGEWGSLPFQIYKPIAEGAINAGRVMTWADTEVRQELSKFNQTWDGFMTWGANNAAQWDKPDGTPIRGQMDNPEAWHF